VYAEHFIFALHLHSFAFLLFTIALLPRFVWPAWRAAPLAMLCILVYLAGALRNAYRQSWPRAIGKVALLTVSYLLVSVVATTLTLLYALVVT
jgi:hypothetical protein